MINMNRKYFNDFCKDNIGSKIALVFNHDKHKLIGKPILFNDRYLIREDNGCLLDLNPKNIDDIYVL